MSEKKREARIKTIKDALKKCVIAYEVEWAGSSGFIQEALKELEELHKEVKP